ncbi:MAG: diacylglycerol kinase (ATP) [Maribacter sp.]|jgi:diacylglycerol kinase (ATP)
MKKISFIVNPISGTMRRRKDMESLLDKHLDKSKYNYEVVLTEYAGHAIELSKNAKENGSDIVVAVGGDGSVNEVSSSLIGTDITLGILPGGSGNGFAMHMGIGRKLAKAIKILNKGKVKKIDTIELNGKPCVSLSGVGFAANIAYKFKESTQRGFMNYLKITLEQAYKFPFQKYEISVDGQPFMKRECLMIEVANSTTFGYNFKPAPLAKVDDELLELVMVNKTPKYNYFGSIIRMINGQIHKSFFMERIPCKKVTIKIPENSFVHMDGEGFMQSEELHYKIVPHSLNVICDL